MATALDRVHAKVKRPLILALFLLLAGTGAWPQNGFHPAQGQRWELRSAQSSLPDAPSTVPAKQRERFQAFVEANNPLIYGEGATGATPSFSALYGAPAPQKEALVFSGKNADPSPLKQGLRYHPLTSDSFLSRASYAASRLFITRDNSGRRKLNTSYLLEVLAIAATSRTYRLYRTQYPPGTFGNLVSRQSVSNTFGNFGSTVGGDVGKNIFHQFWPRIHQILGGH